MIPASKKIIPFPRLPVRRAFEHELAFLPAALEVVETPASPIGRAIGATIIAIFCLALAWACLGTVDIVAIAPGRIIPSGSTKTIQPFDTGVVRAIHVHDGQSVKAGDTLIELDPTMTEADVEHAKAELSQKQAERDAIAATISKFEATIPVLEQKVEVRKYLSDKGLGSKLVYLTDYQELIGQQQDLIVQKSRYREAEAAVAAAAQDVIKAEHRTKLQLLTSPVDGVVQQLAVHTVGGVVTPAQPLLVVVPADAYLEIEAMVSNHDIGFVRTGQGAEIKVDTFNFTRYGLLHGKVLSLSQDAISRDRSQDKDDKTATGSKESAAEQSFYSAKVSIDQAQMHVDGSVVNLGPGMAVTVEIKTGTRRIISYLLSPVARYGQEVLRER
jgi:multidrug efflux pump subunit AcrA (membrane-fusion protein)